MLQHEIFLCKSIFPHCGNENKSQTANAVVMARTLKAMKATIPCFFLFYVVYRVSKCWRGKESLVHPFKPQLQGGLNLPVWIHGCSRVKLNSSLYCWSCWLLTLSLATLCMRYRTCMKRSSNCKLQVRRERTAAQPSGKVPIPTLKRH